MRSDDGEVLSMNGLIKIFQYIYFYLYNIIPLSIKSLSFYPLDFFNAFIADGDRSDWADDWIADDSVDVAGLLRSPSDAVQALEVAFQTAAIGPGGVEILVVIVLLKFLETGIKNDFKQ